tara:strand:- start:698 stop:880 length:183 start_codon:yes stop_codon:yes gene_type:complete
MTNFTFMQLYSAAPRNISSGWQEQNDVQNRHEISTGMTAHIAELAVTTVLGLSKLAHAAA